MRAAKTSVQLLGAGVVRRATKLADQRDLIYYDDPGTLLPPERALDSRTLAARPHTAQMRQDVLTGDWISVATARQSRTVLPGRAFDPLAPQTATNPSEIPSLYDVAVFENRSPAFGPDLGVPDLGVPDLGLPGLGLPGLARSRAGVGRCEVICFSPDSSGSFGTQSVVRARTVIEAWADRTAALSQLPGIEQVFLFENRGEEIGVTLQHPHGQVYGYPYVTPRTKMLLAQTKKLGKDLFDQILRFEANGPRTVLQGEHFTAFVPFAARWPIEVHLVPHRHVADMNELTHAERDELAPLYLRLLRGIDQMYDTPTPYIAAWHQAPVRGGRDSARLHLQLTSPRRAADKLKFLAGSEAAMGAWVADIAAEAAAEHLRDALSKVVL